MQFAADLETLEPEVCIPSYVYAPEKDASERSEAVGDKWTFARTLGHVQVLFMVSI